MSRPYNNKNNQYIVFLKSKGAKNPCKSTLNIHNCNYITVHALTAIEAFTKALNISRENDYFISNELIPYHTRIDRMGSNLYVPNCKNEHLMKHKCENVCAVECVNGNCPNIDNDDNITCMDCYVNKGCEVCSFYENGCTII